MESNGVTGETDVSSCGDSPMSFLKSNLASLTVNADQSADVLSSDDSFMSALNSDLVPVLVEADDQHSRATLMVKSRMDVEPSGNTGHTDVPSCGDSLMSTLNSNLV